MCGWLCLARNMSCRQRRRRRIPFRINFTPARQAAKAAASCRGGRGLPPPGLCSFAGNAQSRGSLGGPGGGDRRRFRRNDRPADVPFAAFVHGERVYGVRSTFCRRRRSHAGSACAITHISFKSGRSRSYSVLWFVIKTASSTREACRGPCSETTGCSGCVRRVCFRWRCSAGSVLKFRSLLRRSHTTARCKTGSRIETPARQRSGVFCFLFQFATCTVPLPHEWW